MQAASASRPPQSGRATARRPQPATTPWCFSPPEPPASLAEAAEGAAGGAAEGARAMLPPRADARAGAEGPVEAAAEAGRLRCEVARLQAQLVAEKAARRRLQRARVVCPDCDEMVGPFSHATGNALTPHACTPRT